MDRKLHSVEYESHLPPNVIDFYDEADKRRDTDWASYPPVESHQNHTAPLYRKFLSYEIVVVGAIEAAGKLPRIMRKSIKKDD